MKRSKHSARFGQLAEAIRQSAPLVHNITNLVMQNDTADAVAAVGGTQITLHTVEEARGAAAICAALAINPGTLDEAWLQCARQALDVAGEHDKPWVLDPVAVGLTPYRTQAMRELLTRRPAVLKANASEILALAEIAAGGRGADSVHEVDEAGDAARRLAKQFGCVVVVTGEQDLITDGEHVVRIANGAPLMGRMIGSGCMLTSVIACYLAVSNDPFEAAQAAVAHFTIAGQLAAQHAAGPGTLKPHLIDELYNMSTGQLEHWLRMESA